MFQLEWLKNLATGCLTVSVCMQDLVKAVPIVSIFEKVFYLSRADLRIL